MWNGRSASVTSLAFLILTVLVLWTPAAEASEGEGEPPAAQKVINTQSRIENAGRWVEIELTSSKPFPVRALPPVLQIGNQHFVSSRHPDDGRLETLIFQVPKTRFEALSQGAPVQVFYALSIERSDEDGVAVKAIRDGGGHVWDFGTLNKALLGQPADSGDTTSNNDSEPNQN